MSKEERKHRLIWIDLEMTGLDTVNDSIIEIATIVTDNQLNVLATGPELAIHHDEAVLKAMDDWNLNQHTQSGLWQRVLESSIDMKEAETQTLGFLRTWVAEGASPMCGNSICQDRRFLARQMPRLEAYFHYRNLDVSTLKELKRRWAPHLVDDYKKRAAHTALSDIEDSISELAFYRKHMGALAGLPASSE